MNKRKKATSGVLTLLSEDSVKSSPRKRARACSFTRAKGSATLGLCQDTLVLTYTYLTVYELLAVKSVSKELYNSFNHQMDAFWSQMYRQLSLLIKIPERATRLKSDKEQKKEKEKEKAKAKKNEKEKKEKEDENEKEKETEKEKEKDQERKRKDIIFGLEMGYYCFECNFDGMCVTCDTCGASICKTDAMKNYGLNADELELLTYSTVDNPHHHKLASMKLFNVQCARILCAKKYNGLSNFCILQRDKHDKKLVKVQMTAQKKAVEDAAFASWHKQLKADALLLNSQMSEAERKEELVDALAKEKLKLRKDSRLCNGFVSGQPSCLELSIDQIVAIVFLIQQMFRYSHRIFSQYHDDCKATLLQFKFKQDEKEREKETKKKKGKKKENEEKANNRKTTKKKDAADEMETEKEKETSSGSPKENKSERENESENENTWMAAAFKVLDKYEDRWHRKAEHFDRDFY